MNSTRSADTQSPSTLCANNLSKTFKSRQVVKDVSIKVDAGEVVGLLGPNGAGKTTSFYMIVGLIQTDSGSITLDDADLTSHPLHSRAQNGIGYLPQEASIFRKLSVQDNILSILQIRKDLSKKEQLEKLEALLNEFHITHIRDSQGMALSGGERRRVEIARALAAEPRYILLDEPFAGVDPISVIDIQKIIRHLSERGIGVLITDHNVRETLGICERAYILNAGEVIAQGEPSTILENPTVKDVYLGQHFSL